MRGSFGALFALCAAALAHLPRREPRPTQQYTVRADVAVKQLAPTVHWGGGRPFRRCPRTGLKLRAY